LQTFVKPAMPFSAPTPAAAIRPMRLPVPPQRCADLDVALEHTKICRRPDASAGLIV
jgi:hypothetical protein